MTAKQIINLFFVAAGAIAFTACSENSGNADGDYDNESINAEVELEAEPERERPVNPDGVGLPKTLWRDEVETGQIFTWGHLPREFHWSSSMIYGKNRPMVWDRHDQRVLMVDPYAYYKLQEEWDDRLALYSITEEKTDLIVLHVPELNTDQWINQYQNFHVYDIDIVGRILLIAFDENITINGSTLNHILGILTYDLDTEEIKWLYQYVTDSGHTDIIGGIEPFIGERFILRKKSGFYLADLNGTPMQPVNTECITDQPYYSTCQGLSYSDTYISEYFFNSDSGEGLIYFMSRLASAKISDDDTTINLAALEENTGDLCHEYKETPACQSDILHFSDYCCKGSRQIKAVNQIPLVMPISYDQLFAIDLPGGRLVQVAGLYPEIIAGYISPDGTHATNAYLGEVESWDLADNGDLLYFEPTDFSIRGIAGPLDELIQAGLEKE